MKDEMSITNFTLLSFEQTGLNFNNKLDETTYMNGFYYEYFYNGGGLAVTDFNNDELIDIYFVSNLRTNKLYLNQGNLKFQNVSVKSNAQGKAGGFPTGVTVVDINDDGLKDIYILKSGRFDNDELLRNELLINQGVDADGVPRFSEEAKNYGLDLPHYSTQASFFDYDKDGDLDMFLINHNIEIYEIDEVAELSQHASDKIGEKLFRNDNGYFINVTQEAGIISNNIGFGLALAVGDVNNDGWPDVYTSNDYYEKDHLYLNNRDGTFTETSLQSFNHISMFSMGSDIADINNDKWLDIVTLDMMAEDNYTQKASMSGMNVSDFHMVENLGLHRQYMYNALQVNNGVQPGTWVPLFSDVAQMAGISSTDWSWSPLLFDINNDGLLDLFVSNGIKRDFRNNDFLIYLEKRYQEGIRKSEVDLEKHVDDLLEKLPDRKKENYFGINKGNLKFEHLKFEQPPSFSSGAAYADFDNDGDLDLVVNNTDDFAYLYKNNSSDASFLSIKLKGPKGNRDGIGARVQVTANGSDQTREVYHSRGFQSAMAIPLHFGLGTASKIDSIIIRWPDGQSQLLVDVQPNELIEIAYDPTSDRQFQSIPSHYLFNDVSQEHRLTYKHHENVYNDFANESLLPHKMSQSGPGLAVEDINGDGLEDFFVGGAMNQSGKLFIQLPSGEFIQQNSPALEADKDQEDTGAVFIDADNDGDQDLYVVSGGNEFDMGNPYYRDRFYVNDGAGGFIRSKSAIPEVVSSGKVVKAGDFDQDGDLDLFVGSRVLPRRYGYSSPSYLLENRTSGRNIKFVDVTKSKIPDLTEHGMVTDALWVDIEGDGQLELMLAIEWGNIELFKFQGDQFTDVSSRYGLNHQVGWWYSLAKDDIDGDGDTDLIAGNLGLNYKYKASSDEPFHLFLNDFDQNESQDIVLGYHQNGAIYPLRGRECSSNQIPFIKEKFKTYDAFARAELKDVYGEALNRSLHKAATNFASCVLINHENSHFDFKPLPNEVQISSINQILVDDINQDAKNDILLFGNLYGSEVETPRNDASFGHHLQAQMDGGYRPIPATESGLYIKGEVTETAFIKVGSDRGLLVARNDNSLILLMY